MNTSRFFRIAGACFGFLGVAFGAVAVHTIKGKLTPDMLVIFETGLRYQMFHAIALFVVAWAFEKSPSKLTDWSGRYFIAGMFLFSGVCYVEALTGENWISGLSQVGGLFWLVGWLLLGIHFCKNK